MTTEGFKMTNALRSVATLSPRSLPGLLRASTTFAGGKKKDGDGRDKRAFTRVVTHSAAMTG